MARLSSRMPPISHPFLSTKILILQLLCLRASSPFHVGKILIYAIPNADYQKIDLKPPQTKQNKAYFSAEKAELFK